MTDSSDTYLCACVHACACVVMTQENAFDDGKKQRRQPLVLVYKGEGVAEQCLRHTVETFRALLGDSYTIELVDASFLMNPSTPWEELTELFILPGGRDMPFVRDINGACLDRLDSFVKCKGGRFVGICAGAYFACQDIEFEKGRKSYEIIGTRWGLFSGITAIGSLFKYPSFEYGSERGARALAIQCPYAPSFLAYYNGGCRFKLHDQEHDQVEIVANTIDGLGQKVPVMISQSFANGGGRAFLSGVHFEYDMTNEWSTVQSVHPKVAQQVISTNGARMQFLQWLLFDHLGLIDNTHTNGRDKE